MSKDTRKTLTVKVTEAEYERIKSLAEHDGCESMSDFIRERCLDEATNTQLRIELSEIRNVLQNVLLGQKITSARMDAFYKSISTRMTEKNPKTMSAEERAEVQERTGRTFTNCLKEALEKTLAHYIADGDDPLYLIDFGEMVPSDKG